MSSTAHTDTETLSPWWGRAVAFTFVMGFAVLILLTFKAYQNAPLSRPALSILRVLLFTPEKMSGVGKRCSLSMD